ncbi:MAG: hypothetical protein CWE10_11630 [Symbiobacterium thermophilum]|uniref:YlbF family regulator n=1 Tax=Symbiobacterium thermophilum TaxID=2734 RepID=A0A953IA41_SYMTR|nr:hypothetical protein [Symbiobacterium thermophilum]
MGGDDVAVATRRDVWLLARELAEAIAETPEVQEYRRTEDAVLADPDAVALIREYEAAKRAVKLSRGRPPEEQKALVERFLAIEERFNAHPVIQAYWNARVALDAFMERINAVVTFPITGETASRAKGGCGSGSCGCGG